MDGMQEARTVLIVEDEPLIRDLAGEMFSELGFRVLLAGSGQQALDIMAGEAINMLFTDVVMPGDINGVEVAIRARLRSPHLDIILTSGFPGDHIHHSPSGARFLRKPYCFADLERLVKTETPPCGPA